MYAVTSSCVRCGRRACCVDMYSASLCSGCLKRSVNDRVLRWLRKASPRPKDSIILVSRGDAQSIAALKLVSSTEKDYDTTIRVLEISERPVLRSECGAYDIEYAYIEASYETYTAFRLTGQQYLNVYEGALVALPDTIEDLTAYALGEVFLGDRRGIELDARHRVAYPLGAVSLRELHQLFPGELQGASPLFKRARARGIVEWAMRSSPTLFNSTVRALLETIKAFNKE